MSKREIKQYEITNFTQLVNLATAENFEALAKDLTSWLAFVIKAKESNIKFENTFIWHDDGENGVFLKITEKDGEVVYAQLKEENNE